MAIKLEDKTNVIAPDATFPFGDLKDNSGANDGVPLNRAVISDYWQFFAKMMDASGIAFNDLLDDDVNGFQYFLAFIKNIRDTAASTTEKGTVERATQTEVDTGSDTTRHLTPSLLKAAKTVMGVDGSVKLRTKVIEIGDWDMDATPNINVAHGVVAANIRTVFVMISNDEAPLFYFDLSKANSSGVVDGFSQIDVNTGTDIFLERRTGGSFDTTSFNATSFNRGWITIQYEI